MMTRFPATLVALIPLCAGATPDTVRLPRGDTPLGDIGIYRVAYQSYGGAVVEMPPGWSGHFESVSGISYAPGGRVLGRRALLLHSPWRVKPGKVWIDYPLTLPRATPITFRFGIAMRPDVVAPDKSDGVTFSAWLQPTPDAPFKKLMRRHWKEGKWQDYSFDLSRYAGSTITLRLQTEPGPANSPSFDFSYFGDATLTCGGAKENLSDKVRQFTETRAYRAADRVSLERLGNTPDRGVAPGCLFDGGTFIEQQDDAWLFRYRGPDCEITYTWRPASGTLDDFSVAVDGGRPFRPMAGGGIVFAQSAGRAAGRRRECRRGGRGSGRQDAARRLAVSPRGRNGPGRMALRDHRQGPDRGRSVRSPHRAGLLPRRGRRRSPAAAPPSALPARGQSGLPSSGPTLRLPLPRLDRFECVEVPPRRRHIRSPDG
ncbi:MAG: hypothetical protein GXP31_03820 [Kiritimatiellaeota bacterium]|nr:hypothetical protein [Kiritimatiellota bacterium]